MTETEIMYTSEDLLLGTLLGAEETQILHAIDSGYSDIDSIHFLTGIPLLCIKNKVKALVGLGFVKAEPCVLNPVKRLYIANHT